MYKHLNKSRYLYKYNTLGQTVLELLVAMTLIIFFLLGVVVLEVYAIRNIKFAQDKSLATKLARQQLERARVVRDSAGINALSSCELASCYINSRLTPIAIIPTGAYEQTLTVEVAQSQDCPPPADITITPYQVYKATANVSWSQGVEITPPKEVKVSSCITDWR